MSLEENIKEWVKLDNDIKQLNEKIKLLKTEKKNYDNNILQFVSSNNLDNATVKISNGKLKFVDVNYSQPLTYKFLFDCLNKFFNNNNDKVTEIIKFIKSEREIKTIREIKRYFVEESLQPSTRF
jgi:hypothetical protein